MDWWCTLNIGILVPLRLHWSRSEVHCNLFYIFFFAHTLFALLQRWHTYPIHKTCDERRKLTIRRSLTEPFIGQRCPLTMIKKIVLKSRRKIVIDVRHSAELPCQTMSIESILWLSPHTVNTKFAFCCIWNETQIYDLQKKRKRKEKCFRCRSKVLCALHLNCKNVQMH